MRPCSTNESFSNNNYQNILGDTHLYCIPSYVLHMLHLYFLHNFFRKKVHHASDDSFGKSSSMDDDIYHKIKHISVR